MASSVEFVKGPLVSELQREAAEEALQRHPRIAKGAGYAIDNVEGRWVAAIVVEADLPFGGPADASEEAPGPKSEGPDDTAPDPESPEGPPSDNGGESPEGPPSEGGDSEDKDKKDGKGGELGDIKLMLDALFDGLGIPNPVGDPSGLGGDPNDPSAMPPPPPPGGPGMGGPPHGGGDQHIIHEKALKPGEVPPGGTPIGAPAFSHVRDDHPWKHMAGKVASIYTSDTIGDRPITDVHNELVSLANELGNGYKLAGLHEGVDESGQRIANAVISLH